MNDCRRPEFSVGQQRLILLGYVLHAPGGKQRVKPDFIEFGLFIRRQAVYYRYTQNNTIDFLNAKISNGKLYLTNLFRETVVGGVNNFKNLNNNDGRQTGFAKAKPRPQRLRPSAPLLLTSKQNKVCVKSH